MKQLMEMFIFFSIPEIVLNTIEENGLPLNATSKETKLPYEVSKENELLKYDKHLEKTKGYNSTEDKNTSRVSMAASFGNGRLGNQLCNLASQYALYKEFGIPSYLSLHSYYVLRKTFVLGDLISKFPSTIFLIKNTTFFDRNNMSIVYISNLDLMFRRFEIMYTYRYSWFLKLEPYVCDVKGFSPYISELQSTILRFKPTILGNAKRIMHKLRESRYKAATVISIHIRMTDIKMHLHTVFQAPMATQDYFTRAIIEMKRHFGENVIFIAFSDDTRKAKELLLTVENKSFDIIFPIFDDKESSKSTVLALLSLAEASILTYSTFGLWGALLGKPKRRMILPKETIKTDIGFYVFSSNITNAIFV